MITDDDLLARAKEVWKQAYAPYSGFRVGSAILSASGNVYVGCNVENASYGATICAERNAIAAMVAAGETQLARVAIYTEAPIPAMPCGLCRQVLFEFGEDVPVRSATPTGQEVSNLRELLPRPFEFERAR